MQKLRAKNGKQYNFQADPETLQQLKHCRMFTERSLNVQVSDGILLRRAVALLTSYYDKLLKQMNRGKEVKDDELFWLDRVAEPYFLTEVEPIAEGQAMLTYADRLKRERKKVTLGTILKEASAGLDRRYGLHLTPDKMKRRQPRNGEE